MYWRMDPDSVRSISGGDKTIVSLAYRLDDEFIAKLEEDLKRPPETQDMI